MVLGAYQEENDKMYIRKIGLRISCQEIRKKGAIYFITDFGVLGLTLLVCE